MLTEMQNPASPPSTLDSDKGAKTVAERKTRAVTRNCESLKYLIRHLSAVRSETSRTLDPTTLSPGEGKET